MKTIRKNLLLLAFAAGALFVIGNNLSGSPHIEVEDPGNETPIYDCPGGPKECARITVGNTLHIFYKRQN